jgi:hypothetical protein
MDKKKDKERARINRFVKRKLGGDADKFDTNAEIDSNISVAENLTIIGGKISPVSKSNGMKAQSDADEARENAWMANDPGFQKFEKERIATNQRLGDSIKKGLANEFMQRNTGGNARGVSALLQNAKDKNKQEIIDKIKAFGDKLERSRAEDRAIRKTLPLKQVPIKRSNVSGQLGSLSEKFLFDKEIKNKAAEKSKLKKLSAQGFINELKPKDTRPFSERLIDSVNKKGLSKEEILAGVAINVRIQRERELKAKSAEQKRKMKEFAVRGLKVARSEAERGTRQLKRSAGYVGKKLLFTRYGPTRKVRTFIKPARVRVDIQDKEVESIFNNQDMNRYFKSGDPKVNRGSMFFK